MATVEQLTNIRIDHVVELAFNAFIRLTDICSDLPGVVSYGGSDG